MRWIVFLVGLLVAVPAAAQPKLLQAHASGSPPTYTGPGDVVASATFWFGLRAYTAAYAATPGIAINVRRASDNVACDFNVATAGGFGLTTATCNSSTQGGVSYATFVGTDATASCTIAGTAVVCTGASATLHVGDLLSGVGITEPCLVTVTNGSTTATASLPGTTTSCGTVSVAETVTFQVAGLVPELYDQTSNGHNFIQNTAGNQPQFLPKCLNSLPCLSFNGTTQQMPMSTGVTINQPASLAAVAIRVGGFASFGDILRSDNSGGALMRFTSSANQIQVYAGTALNQTAADSAWHSFIGVYNGATSYNNVDNGTTTSGNAGTTALNNTMVLGNFNGGNTWLNGRVTEGGGWPVAFTPTQQTNECHNAFAYWATSVSC